MTIGRFSRLSGLSIQALRHYDDVDLLHPADVDASTGYHRYLASQISIARLIVDLRWLDVPLEDVRVLVRIRRAPGSSRSWLITAPGFSPREHTRRANWPPSTDTLRKESPCPLRCQGLPLSRSRS